MNNKYNTLLKKGLYVTREKAEEEAKYRATKVELEYTGLRLNTVPDSLITYTDQEVEEFYKKTKEDYKQRASRKVEYVTFDILPSQEDDQLAKKWIEDIKTEFEQAENDEQFVNLNGDTGFDDRYYKKDELSEDLDAFAFSADVGDVYGPYFEDGAYKLAKLSTIEYLPDSVRARHILIKPDETTNDISEARFMVDSLKELVMNGASFAQLARQYGTDGTAQNGGDLGWFKQGDMVQPFSDSCFFNPEGHVTTATTQFGVHLIEITDRGNEVKKVQLGIIDREVIPSNKTIQFIYQQASEFAGLNNNRDKFDQAIIEQGLNKRISPPLNINDKKISGLESPREMVRWAFNAELNDMSPVFEFGDKFVIAVLTEVDEEGIAPLDDIRVDIENLVKREKAKEYLYDKMMEANIKSSSLEDLAKNLGTEIQTASNVTFTGFSIPGLGVENEVLANALALDEGERSGVIKGTNGVYVIKVTDIIESEPVDTETEQNKLIRSYYSRVDFQAFETLKDLANIEDKRYKFY